jgi:hypothetical protein
MIFTENSLLETGPGMISLLCEQSVTSTVRERNEALAIASELTSTLGPALTDVAAAVRCASPDRSPVQSAENAIEMARAVGFEMARATQVNRVAELERVEDTNKVRHGDPAVPVWYDFRPAQAQDFGGHAQAWEECVMLYAYTHRRQMSDATHIGMTELAAALPREGDVSTALGSMGPALLTYREGRPKLRGHARWQVRRRADMFDESVTGRRRGRRRGEHGGCGRRGESGSSAGGDGGVVDTIGHHHGPRHDARQQPASPSANLGVHFISKKFIG